MITRHCNKYLQITNMIYKNSKNDKRIRLLLRNNNKLQANTKNSLIKGIIKNSKMICSYHIPLFIFVNEETSIFTGFKASINKSSKSSSNLTNTALDTLNEEDAMEEILEKSQQYHMKELYDNLYNDFFITRVVLLNLFIIFELNFIATTLSAPLSGIV